MKKIFIASMSAELGGIEKSLITFLQYLVTLPRYEITLMLWKKRGHLLSSIPPEIRIIDAPTSGNIKEIMKTFDLHNLQTYIKIKYYTRKNKPWNAFPCLDGHYDIAIAYSQDGYSPYYVIDNVKADRKYMWYHHGAYTHTGIKKELDKMYYPKFDKVIPVSESIKEILQKELRTDGISYLVIPNLLNIEEIIVKSQEPCLEFEGVSCLKLVTVGRLSPEKGQMRALKVAKMLKENGIQYKWLFVGDGPEKENCLKKLVEYGLADYVTFIGAKSNPYTFIGHADIYVAPSYVEADPVTIQEAIILNKPIVGSDIPSIVKAMSVANYQGVVDFNNYSAVCNLINLMYNQNGLPLSFYKPYKRNSDIINLLIKNILYENICSNQL